MKKCNQRAITNTVFTKNNPTVKGTYSPLTVGLFHILSNTKRKRTILYGTLTFFIDAFTRIPKRLYEPMTRRAVNP